MPLSFGTVLVEIVNKAAKSAATTTSSCRKSLRERMKCEADLATLPHVCMSGVEYGVCVCAGSDKKVHLNAHR